MRQILVILILTAAATCGLPRRNGSADPGTPRRLGVENASNNTAEDSTTVETSEVTSEGQESRTIFGIDINGLIKSVVATGAEWVRQSKSDGPCFGVVNLCTDADNSTAVLLQQIDEMQENHQHQLQDVIMSYTRPRERRP